MKESTMEFVGGVAFLAIVVVVAWAYCKMTPNQLSGETDRCVTEGGAK